MSEIPKPFNLLRWFSIASLLALLPVAGGTGFFLSYFITQETLQRDAILTSQFIQNLVETEGIHAKLGPNVTLPELLDERNDTSRLTHLSAADVKACRNEFRDHIKNLPDVLLTNIFARDGLIVWSSNPALIGQPTNENEELHEALQSKILVARGHINKKHEKEEQLFLDDPKEFFVENYIPLYAADGSVAVVVEVYKEPQSLLMSIQRGYWLVWISTIMAAALIYLTLFSLARRASNLLAAQQQRLVETESLVAIGEMSAAVAHGLRNPLANIRSSAELAQDADPESVRKSTTDIISQVDRLSKWVRELLMYSRPVTGEREAVDLAPTIDEVVDSFASNCEKNNIRVLWDRSPNLRPRVLGNKSLTTQVFQSVLANAIEAMPRGGEIRISMQPEPDTGKLEVTVADTGVGIPEKQLAQAFKPFHTTKRHGLGVGLAMVKRVMERFDGAVQLSSHENQGTEVRLLFSLTY